MDCWCSFYIYERTPDTPSSTPHILVYILFADSLRMIVCSRRQINYLWVWLYKSACCARSSWFREIGSVLLRATEKLQLKEKERYTGVVYSLRSFGVCVDVRVHEKIQETWVLHEKIQETSDLGKYMGGVLGGCLDCLIED